MSQQRPLPTIENTPVSRRETAPQDYWNGFGYQGATQDDFLRNGAPRIGTSQNQERPFVLRRDPLELEDQGVPNRFGDQGDMSYLEANSSGDRGYAVPYLNPNQRGMLYPNNQGDTSYLEANSSGGRMAYPNNQGDTSYLEANSSGRQGSAVTLRNDPMVTGDTSYLEATSSGRIGPGSIDRVQEVVAPQPFLGPRPTSIAGGLRLQPDPLRVEDPLEEMVEMAETPSFQRTPEGSYIVDSEQGRVVDIVSHYYRTYFLYQDGRIGVEGKKISVNLTSTTGDERLISLFSFGGRLGGLSNRNRIYFLESNAEQSAAFYFFPLQPSHFNVGSEIVRNNDKVLRVSTTSNSKNLVLQYERYLSVYDIYGAEVFRESGYKPSLKRVYGKSLQIYADLDTQSYLLKSSMDTQILSGIYDVAISPDGDIIPLTRSRALEMKYTGIRYINWKPYYLKS